MWVIRAILWLLSWIGVLSIGAVIATTCTQGDHDSWSVSFFVLSPVNLAIISGLLLMPRKSRALVPLTIPHLVLVPISFTVVCQYFIGTTIEGHHFCSIHSKELEFDSYGIEWWYRLWAPTQFALLAFYVFATSAEWKRTEVAS